jgi:hypothetical protein
MGVAERDHDQIQGAPETSKGGLERITAAADDRVARLASGDSA